MFRFVFVHLVYFLSFCSGLVFVCLLGYLVSLLLRLSFFLFALCFVFLVSLVSVLDFAFMMEMGSKVTIVIVHVEATPRFSVTSNAVASWVLLGWIMASWVGPWGGAENEPLSKTDHRAHQ